MSVAPKDLAKPGSASHTILIVDGEPTNLRLLSDYLKDAGFRVLVSRDGESALRRARYARPDLILLDVMLPGIDGFETCCRLKADETLRDIPVIFMSALIEPEDKARGFQLGAVDYIPKPFQHEEVLGRVTTHLRLRDLTRELREAKESLERRVEERTAELIQANEELHAEIVERKRVERLLQALNAAALAMQRALTPDEVFVIVAEELKKLGFHCMILSRDEDQGKLFIKYASVDTALELAIEELTSIRQKDWAFHIKAVDIYREVVLKGKTVLMNGEMVERTIGQVVPVSTAKLVKPLVQKVGSLRSIAAPLIAEDNVIGLLSVHSDDLLDSDVPAITAFAHQVAAAWRRAQLYEAEREQRRQVEQSQAQLVRSERLAATGRLAASLAHEINNPLQIIHNSLQLMLNLPFGPDKRQEYLQMADAEVERLMDTVTRILEFARPTQRKMQPTDVNDAIEQALALTNKYLQHNHIVLQRDLWPALPSIVAAPDELRQVFLNLVLNAVDAMPEGGSLHVSSWLGDDGRLAVAFADTGPGIAPEHLEHIFEPFFSTKEEGTGLGLSISYEVVEQYKGEITVESVVGEGTTLTVWLPVMAT